MIDGNAFHLGSAPFRACPSSTKGGVPLTEKELVKALHRGDLSALEVLLDRYTSYVSSVISRILRGGRRTWRN